MRTYGEMDRHDEAFRNIANAPKNTYKINLCKKNERITKNEIRKNYLHSKKIILRTRNHCFATCHIRDLI
jgi:hypothetical protein